MKTLPKIEKPVNVSIRYDENTELFPRCQHPDTRPWNEVEKILIEKGVIKEKEIKTPNNSLGVRVVETGQEFRSFSQCEKYFGLKHQSLSEYFRGKLSIKHLNGLTFERIF